MENKSNTFIHTEDCERPRIKEECFDQDEITESKNNDMLHIDTHFIKCAQNSDMDIKVGIKQETWDANEPSCDVKSNPNQLSTCQGTDIIKGDNLIDIKEAHNIQHEISPESQKTHLHQNETYFIDCNESSDVGIVEQAWDPNGVSSDFKCNPEQLLSSDLAPSVGTGTLKATDEINVKQEPCWVEGTSADSLNKDEETDSRNNKGAEDVSLLESSRSCINAVHLFNPTQLHKNKDTSSLSAETNIPAQKCEKEHRCKSCGKSFKLLLHLPNHNLAHKEFNCRNCCNNPTYSGVLNYQHILNHKAQYVCESCGKTFMQLDKFKLHLLIHEEKRQFNCEICGKGFKQFKSLKVHVLLHDADKRPYNCHICEKSFTQLHYLKSHLLVHDDKRQYKCQICEKGFKRLTDLKTHLLVHDDKRLYKCEICEKSFKRLDILKSHLLVHDDKRQYRCKICEKGFKRLSDLKTHLLVHDDKRQLKCEICEKSFKRLDVLKLHLLVHGEKRQFKCQVCGKSFNQLSGLKSHLLLHDDKRQYKCKICEKSFKQLPGLKSHLSVHDDNRHYKCQICEKTFKHLRSLKTHLIVHDDK